MARTENNNQQGALSASEVSVGLTSDREDRQGMLARRIVSRVLLVCSGCVGMLALVYSWQGFSTWRRLSSMTASERAEWVDMCSTPAMDCEPDPMVWLRLALYFGLAAITLVLASRARALREPQCEQ